MNRRKDYTGLTIRRVNILFIGQLRLIQGSDHIYGKGRLEVFNEEKHEWGTINSHKFGYQEAQVACRAMGFVLNANVVLILCFRFQCVLDWGLAKDWGIPVENESKFYCNLSFEFDFIRSSNWILGPRMRWR